MKLNRVYNSTVFGYNCLQKLHITGTVLSRNWSARKCSTLVYWKYHFNNRIINCM